MANQKIFRALVVALIALVFTGASAQNVDEIINKHVEAMGGAAKLSNLKSMKIDAAMQVMGMEIPTTTTIVQQRGFRSETDIQGTKVIQALDGTTGWTINPMTGQSTATPLPDEMVKAMSGQVDLTGLYNYKAKGYKAELIGQETLEGAPVYLVKVTNANGVTLTNYISKDTYYIVRTLVKANVNGQDVETKMSQSNFKKVDGITYPFSAEIESPAMPGAITMVVKSVQVNPKIDESIFAMPKN
ncbi:outer membrane lipoprotein-sorting protein [Telluribacter sp. SYSU D00476]|uniref:outer membrane lipoprotein-sorting protein n=1 Tax=Telluribacter sp. SYSU D00476 TaxID=2811430 RepID=UPI001FF64935|nr:outer membrane lipoprotein-sorting protein [Telluribacter sp. SYSU D00476]